MTLADAKLIVERDTDSAVAPVVTADEIEDILTESCEVVDDDGYEPDDTNWGGKYDLLLADAKVFTLKAARVAHQVDFSADGASYKLGERRQAFLDMAKDCRKRRTNSFDATRAAWPEEDAFDTP